MLETSSFLQSNSSIIMSNSNLSAAQHRDESPEVSLDLVTASHMSCALLSYSFIGMICVLCVNSCHAISVQKVSFGILT